MFDHLCRFGGYWHGFGMWFGGFVGDEAAVIPSRRILRNNAICTRPNCCVFWQLFDRVMTDDNADSALCVLLAHVLVDESHHTWMLRL
eukprot:scaffold80681_cov28-Cyclotella_meneghiniana.AAC.1